MKGSRRPGLDIPAVIREGANRNRRALLPKLKLWFVVFDEHLSWLSSLNLTLTAAVLSASANSPQKKPLQALVVITAKIVSDLFAVRSLCSAGFDVAAKTVLRSTSEYFEAALLIVEKPDLAPEFIDAQDNARSNIFWHRYLSKAKTRSLIEERWARTLASEDGGKQMSDWRNSYMDILGMSAHASFSGGAFSALVLAAGDEVEDDAWPGIFGKRSRVSEHTLFWAMVMNFEFLMLCPDLPFRNEQNVGQLVEYDKDDDFHVHISKGRLSLIELSLPIISGQCHPDLQCKIPEPSWLSELPETTGIQD